MRKHLNQNNTTAHSKYTTGIKEQVQHDNATFEYDNQCSRYVYEEEDDYYMEDICYTN